MGMARIKRFLRLETLRTIDPKCLLKLLRRHRKFLAQQGLTLPTVRHAASLDLRKLSEILLSPELLTPGSLLDALFYISDLATRDGMDALLKELTAPALGLGIFGADPADVAVRAYIKDPGLLARMYAETFASRPRRYDYFQAPGDPPPAIPSVTPEALRPLQQHLDGEFASRCRGRGLRISAHPHGTDCVFVVRHADPRRREGAMDGVKESRVHYRPLRIDIVGYDAESGALRVYARAKWETDLYRQSFGKFLFGDIGLFADERRFTLEPLRGGDPACLVVTDIDPIKHVSLTELHLDHAGTRESEVVYKSADVLATMRELQIVIPSKARISQASFAVYIIGEPQPRTLTILPPNEARYSHDGESDLMQRFLGRRGFLTQRDGGTNEDGNRPLLAGN
jgi:hypothetical protein